jgi:hypothetical protein
MKIQFTIDFELTPKKQEELSQKELTNIVGMLQRILRNRVESYRGSDLGGDHASTGWEVKVDDVKITPVGKMK